MMNKKWFRASDAYLISFLIPVLIMIVIFVARGIFPFGEETFLRTDMYHQYAPFFSEFQYKLRNGGSLLYSWDVGLGVNFAALYAYYLASPLNILILLVPKALVLEFMTYMIVFKIGLCGLTASMYFRHHFGRKNFSCAFFGILYAMSGYISAYSWNIMWLDCILLFPLILWGMEKMLRGGSPLLYTVSLGLSILSNYYISIMICLFLVIYFFCLEILNSGKRRPGFLARGIRFAVFSLLAGALAAVLLIPEIFALSMTASSSAKFPDTATQYFTIIDMIARHLPNVQTEQGLDHWPNIYSGTVAFLLIPLYFMNRKIELREKLVYGGLLLFFYLSFSINMLNFIWHGFHYPNSLPCRQSFIYVLLVLVMSYHAYLKRKFLSPEELSTAVFLGISFVLLCQKLITEDDFHWSGFYIAIVLILLYYGFMYLERKNILNENALLCGVLLLLTVETAVNMAVTSVSTTSRTAYTADNADVRKLVESTRKEDKGFYRFEKVTRKTKDDGAWMNFPSVSLFSSTAYKHCSDFFEKMGMEASTNAYSITGSTALMDMLFSVKYSLYTGEAPYAGERGLRYISASGKTYLYENPYALSAGYMLSRQELYDWNTEVGTPALAQNALSTVLGTSPVLQNRLGSFEGDDYVFTVDRSGEYYVYVNNKKVKKVKVYFDDGEKSFDNVDRGFFLELGYLTEGSSVRVHSDTNGQSIDCDAYYFDNSALSEIYHRLSQNTWEITEWKDTKLSGKANASYEGVLITSIPYDEGWRVFVDGKEKKIEKALDTFVMVPLSEGEHTVEMRYFPKGLKAGMVISGVALLLLIFTAYVFRDISLEPGNRMLRSRERDSESRDIAMSASMETERPIEREPRPRGASRGRSRKREKEYPSLKNDDKLKKEEVMKEEITAHGQEPEEEE